jgi:L-lactate dehydrogenase complex protein LldF
VLVTNEGNGRYCTTLPRVHVAVMPVEKVVPRLADVAVLLPLLTSHATGQPLSNYVTMLTGPRRDGETDGPDELHVVILDNRRRTLLGTKYEEMLACIRCGACLNVCPVYRNVSGHAYDAVYSGPMGKVLTPLLSGHTEGADLPFGSTLCHACDDACPVQIPLSRMIVQLRGDAKPNHWWSAWARAWSSPRGYALTTALARTGARLRVDHMVRSWSRTRALPAPARVPFREQWKRR